MGRRSGQPDGGEELHVEILRTLGKLPPDALEGAVAHELQRGVRRASQERDQPLGIGRVRSRVRMEGRHGEGDRPHLVSVGVELPELPREVLEVEPAEREAREDEEPDFDVSLEAEVSHPAQ